MTKDQIMGIVRHSLTFVGGILVTVGLINDATSQEIIGLAITLTGAIWSVIKNKTV